MDGKAVKRFRLFNKKNLDEERKLDPWRTRTRHHLISVSSRPLEVGRWHLDSFRISRTVTVRTLRNSISATCNAGGPNFPCLRTGQGKVNVYIELWSGKMARKKSMANAGIEPTTLALLAPRSNQLS